MKRAKLKISILIPCYNEELTIEKCVLSCLDQTRPADQIVVVDDSSADGTPQILKKFGDKIQVVKTPKNTGNKSYAQEYGLQLITGDFFIATDGDTILDKNFIKIMEQDMQSDSITAVCGYVKSLPYNWLTACRGLDYTINQNIDKLAQDYLDSLFVIPGVAGAFRTKTFKEKIKFSHDTVTEDLDFTYVLHESGCKIKYDRKAICYTQDPTTLKSYINQMRRWFGGGWQNLSKHFRLPRNPGMAFELTLIYAEGLVYSFVMFFLPLVNISFALVLLAIYSAIIGGLAVYAAIKEKRIDFITAIPAYIFLKYVNAWVFMEQFLKEVILKKKNLAWYKPDRVKI